MERVAAKFDKNLDEVVEITDDRVGQDSRYWLDTSKIKNTLGWKMKIDFDSGLDEVKDWVLKYKDDLIKRDFDYIMRG